MSSSRREFFGWNLSCACVFILVLDLMFYVNSVVWELLTSEKSAPQEPLSPVISIVISSVGMFLIWLAFIGTMKNLHGFILPYLTYLPIFFMYRVIMMLLIRDLSNMWVFLGMVNELFPLIFHLISSAYIISSRSLEIMSCKLYETPVYM